MDIYPIEIGNDDDLVRLIRTTGADEKSFYFFQRKSRMLSFFIPDADFRAANALKQELLSRGGDAIVHRGAIEGSIPTSNVVILGTLKTLEDLCDKLRSMPYWGLDEIRSGLVQAISSMGIRRWSLDLPNRGELELGKRTKVMGIINVTDDSFYPGSRVDGPKKCVETALRMHEEGADILDIGAESTRPGSSPLSQEEEASRLIPAIAAVRREIPQAVISADTYRAGTAEPALDSGADMINDISGGAFDNRMFPLLARRGNPVVIMHARNVPGGMHHPVSYGDVIGEILTFFSGQILKAGEAGVNPEQVILDPGIGFSKNAPQNLEVLKGLASFSTLARPLLIGHSRKSTIGKVLGLENPEDRLEGTLALTAFCAMKDVALIRVHDVAENIRALKMIAALKGEGI
ncbi:MAG: Dihydropteroate synthase [Synergistales bacterium 57_84]|nr:MAG: Dihydropteroate synthase [Synergistales bacterium 57_84]